MSLRSGLVGLLALVFGGSAAVGVNKYVATGPAKSPAAETTPVVVAFVDMPRGSSITAEMIKVRDYPKGLVPAGAITKVDDAVGRAVFIPMIKDEPVVDPKLASKGSGRGMAALIPMGMRAFTIHTPSVASGVAGFIMPGNKVDVLLSMDGKRGGVASTLLQNMEILAVDQRIDAPADNRIDPNQMRSVTLLVTPDQAAKLSLSQNKGSLQLSLRNFKDDRPAVTSPARISELEGFQEEPPAVAVAVAPVPVPAPPAPPAVAVAEAPAPVPVPPPAPAAPKFMTIYRGRTQATEQVPLSAPAAGLVSPGPEQLAAEAR